MQDRFKFRIWHKKRKKMYDVLHLHTATWTNGGEWVTAKGFNIITQQDIHIQIENKDGILMQCTGLKDKHGKLIYEGDIVKVQCNREDKCGLFYKTGIIAYELNEKNGHGHADSSFYLKLNNGMCALFSKEKCEVIGNIYDNPELLKGDNNGKD